MEFEIVKEGNEKYLSLKKMKIDEDNYQIQMILNNTIKGLLPIKIRNINNEKEFLYNITAMSSVNNVFERSLMRKDDLTKLVIEIKQLVENLKEYLLCGNNIKFDLNYIYYQAKQKQYNFVFCPVEVDDFDLQMKSLFNQVLDHINYNDREAVSLAYRLQEIASRDNFTIDEMIELALDSKEKKNVIVMEDDEDDLDINEDEIEEEQKETILERIKNIFHKREKEDRDESLENYFVEADEMEKEFGFETDNLSDEDATVLLTQNAAEYIVLKTTNRNPEIMVAPRKFPFVLGKSRRSSDFRVSSDVVSRVHARLNCELGEFTIEDLNSTNGTFVNDERLKPHEIKPIERGDVIKLADIEFVIE